MFRGFIFFVIFFTNKPFQAVENNKKTGWQVKKRKRIWNKQFLTTTSVLWWIQGFIHVKSPFWELTEGNSSDKFNKNPAVWCKHLAFGFSKADHLEHSGNGCICSQNKTNMLSKTKHSWKECISFVWMMMLRLYHINFTSLSVLFCKLRPFCVGKSK